MKIMPLGDSITHGFIVGADEALVGGYRFDLWPSLAPGYYEFVGSLSNGPSGFTSKHHEGHDGYIIGPAANGLDIYDNISSWLTLNPPDVIMLMVGAADLVYGLSSGISGRLTNLLNYIFTLKPSVKIILSTIPPATLYDNSLAVTYNASMPNIVSTLVAAGKNIVLVDSYARMTVADLGSDGVHPNSAGYQKISDAFLRGLLSVTTPNTCCVYNSANINVPSGAWTPLTFDSERYDPTNMHSLTSNPSRITCVTDGIYNLNGSAAIQNGGSGTRVLGIRFNGSTFIGVISIPPVSGDTSWMNISRQYALAVNDYVELMAYQDSGSNLVALALGNYSPEFAAAIQ